MYYVCIENNTVVGIQSYKPAVPSSVEIVEINDDEYQQLMDQTYIFNIQLKQVSPVSDNVLTAKLIEKENAIYLDFLHKTDWQVLRHLRQLSLGIDTSLTNEQYLQLEQERNIAASNVQKI
jgi:hypothetical protein